MTVEIGPVSSSRSETVISEFVLPPDKSLLHRILFIGSLTHSAFRIPIPSPEEISHDVIASVLALESIGVPVELFADHIELQGVGRNGYRAPNHVINCANSGTTARLLMGLLAGQRFNAALSGDDSLSRRPMKRLADQLRRMGAEIVTSMEGTLPVMLRGVPLRGVQIELAVASAQMKSALLLAGLLAEGSTSVREPWQSRDHTERMMLAFGFGIEREGLVTTLDPLVTSTTDDEIEYVVAGDISSAAFLAAAAVLLRRDVLLKGVLLNPTRTRFLDILTLMGVELEAVNVVEKWEEESGDIIIHGSRLTELHPFRIEADDVPLLIDELPMLSILAAFAEGESSIRGALELRRKESDRIRLVAEQLQAFGVLVHESEDGLTIHGAFDRTIEPAPVQHGGDHRLAMAFALAGLRARRPIAIEDAEAANISYPDFFSHLRVLAGDSFVRITSHT
jgi:3-phosphoshikimate 1-carboxyvinyltransferase